MNAWRVCPLILILLTACGNPGPDDSSTNDRESIPAPIGAPHAEEPNPAAAQSVIREYYAAIAAEEYRRAYCLWGDSGRLSNQTFDRFRAGFDNTASVRVHVGEPGRIEGAAGSRYIKIPVHIEAITDAGAIERFTGSYTLRRAVVDGATERQTRWQLYDAQIAPCSGGCGHPDSSSFTATAVIQHATRRHISEVDRVRG